MDFIQTLIQTIWASILLLGWIKVAIVVVAILFISKYQGLLGLLATALFIAYLAHWISF
ncbi:MAG: hypothetical protein UR85_C0004G0016 [Candidatus Nomurabacteria bacterium GW2011_GWF2_35_66]|uniref:Uncharacterized protein n=1 Tax=Candidatus Nomurabacteria bacterium GW2011_GWE1_35_16 TaxID=1618761 RepID=A0A0G0BSV9_9BACT|nr:MAG: hypothetical protein UR55_C0002G0015 [Candidatus Nomurabacteria bacterium GW2011_GWF1_34_20]KKP63594.1 MAG: hypothetical protein UR57_C0002G0015 [Candidatus Nomurabacteria bacterium GW2011_GWE2_34_25]KKP66796.1 MAG: hypothetical protein UR64_C0002G0012 [Candidatus Nomurabacteria bacterium GW2011_GWE1_35_16]KKP83422.1 MAG: hypothetical protein UR85_C0004G0016 [Candidatus Nomurabacteria bacterium GW2011_GWF2_35_66]